MITIISGTNREGSYSIKFALKYAEILIDKGVSCQVLDLKDLPKNFLFSETYGKRTDSYEQLLKKYVYDPNKWMMVSPEYNGSFSGVLKSFIDSIDYRAVKGKKIAMIGVAAGKSGNLRGMDHMTNCMHYMGAEVMPNKLPISQAFKMFDGDTLMDEDTLKLMEAHAEEFIKY